MVCLLVVGLTIAKGSLWWCVGIAAATVAATMRLGIASVLPSVVTMLRSVSTLLLLLIARTMPWLVSLCRLHSPIEFEFAASTLPQRFSSAMPLAWRRYAQVNASPAQTAVPIHDL
jgi:hypothetical protein